MRLLFFTTAFPRPTQPTQGVFNLRLVQALAREHEVTAVAPVSWVESLRGGVRHEADTPIHHPVYFYPPKVLRDCYGWFLWHSVRRGMRPLLETQPPDAVVGYWAHPDGEVAVRLARRVGVPAVVMVGGSDVLLLARQPRRRRCITRVLRAADAVMTLGEDLRQKVLDLGISADRVHVTFRGVDGALFFPGERREARRTLGIAEDGPVLVWAGRMVPVKGLPVLLEACALLQSRGVAFRAYLIGEGPLRQELQARVAQCRLEQSVLFPGPMPQERLADWFRAADGVVLPSHSEGVPNVLREALACGTPCVASGVGGIPDLVQGTNSRLVEPGCPERWAAELAEFLAAPPRVPESKTRAAGWDQAAASLVQVLKSVGARARQPGEEWARCER